MATQRGIEMIIQKPNVVPNPTTWANVCGVDKADMSIENELIVSKRAVCTDRTQPPTITRKYGAQTIKFAVNGAWDDDANGKLIADAAINRTTLASYRVVVPGYGTFDGDWLVESGGFGGDLDNDLQANWSLVNSGSVTFTAA